MEVEVEVAGERHRIQLVSRDISPGGIFLRTERPAPIFKRVKLFLAQVDGAPLELAGEVVRSLGPEQARAKGQPAGMAVAFDEASRRKSRQLLALVQAQASGAAAPPGPSSEARPAAPAEGGSATVARADSLLDELDSLLRDEPAPARGAPAAADDLDIEIEPEVTDASGRLKALAPSAAPETRPASSPAVAATPAGAEALVAQMRQALEEYRRAVKGSTHYDVLQLDRQASAAEVKAAFTRLVQRLKPRLPSAQIPPDLARGLAVALDKIKKAADTLSHAERRRAYDYLLQGDGGA